MILFCWVKDVALYKPSSGGKKEKCQLFHYRPSTHGFDQKNPKKNPEWKDLPVSLCQDIPLIISNANFLCKSCSWYPYGCSCPCWKSTHPARWQIFPLLLFARRIDCWELESTSQFWGLSQTRMGQGADKARLAPLCCVRARKRGRSGREWKQDLGQSLKENEIRREA